MVNYHTITYHGQLCHRHATSVHSTWTCVRFHPEHCRVVRNYSRQGALRDVVVLVEPTLTRPNLLTGTSPACYRVVIRTGRSIGEIAAHNVNTKGCLHQFDMYTQQCRDQRLAVKGTPKSMPTDPSPKPGGLPVTGPTVRYESYVALCEMFLSHKSRPSGLYNFFSRFA